MSFPLTNLTIIFIAFIAAFSKFFQTFWVKFVSHLKSVVLMMWSNFWRYFRHNLRYFLTLFFTSTTSAAAANELFFPNFAGCCKLRITWPQPTSKVFKVLSPDSTENNGRWEWRKVLVSGGNWALILGGNCLKKGRCPVTYMWGSLSFDHVR